MTVDTAVRAPNEAQSLVHDGLWNLVARALPAASTILQGFIVARIVGVERFGALALVQTTVALASLHAPAAIGATSTRYIAGAGARTRQRVRDLQALGIKVALWMGAALAVLGPAFAIIIRGEPDLAVAFGLAGVTIGAIGTASAQTGTLAGLGQFRPVARLGAARALLQLPLVWIGAAVASIEGALGGSLLGWLIVIVYGQTVVAAHEPTDTTVPDQPLPSARILRDFSLPVIVGPVLFVAANTIAYFQLDAVEGGRAEVALLNVAVQWRTIVLFVPTVLAAPLLARFAEAYGNHDSAALRRAMRQGLLTTMAAVLPLVAAIGLLSNVVASLYGDGFEASASVIVTTMIGAAIAAPTTVLETALRGAGRAWATVPLVVLWVVVFAVVLAVTELRAQSVAEAFLWAYVAHFVGALVLWRRTVGGAL